MISAIMLVSMVAGEDDLLRDFSSVEEHGRASLRFFRHFLPHSS